MKESPSTLRQLAGFGTRPDCTNGTRDYCVDAAHQPSDLTLGSVLAAWMLTVCGPDGTDHQGAGQLPAPRCTTSVSGRRSGRWIGVSGRSAGCRG
jgi:hypothetical protein